MCNALGLETSNKLINIFLLFFTLECFWLLDTLLDYTTNGQVLPLFNELKSEPPTSPEILPERMDGMSVRQ